MILYLSRKFSFLSTESPFWSTTPSLFVYSCFLFSDQNTTPLSRPEYPLLLRSRPPASDHVPVTHAFPRRCRARPARALTHRSACPPNHRPPVRLGRRVDDQPSSLPFSSSSSDSCNNHTATTLTFCLHPEPLSFCLHPNVTPSHFVYTPSQWSIHPLFLSTPPLTLPSPLLAFLLRLRRSALP